MKKILQHLNKKKVNKNINENDFINIFNNNNNESSKLHLNNNDILLKINNKNNK